MLVYVDTYYHVDGRRLVGQWIEYLLINADCDNGRGSWEVINACDTE